MGLFEKLNRSATVIIVLIIIFAADGFLLYRYASPPTASAPTPPTDEDAGAAPSTKAPGSSSAETSTLGVGELARACGGSRQEEDCVRDLVSRTAPDAEYVGGRIDVSGSPARTQEVIYFEDPGLKPCEYNRQEYVGNEAAYTVIVLGRGSFGDAEEPGCIPEA